MDFKTLLVLACVAAGSLAVPTPDRLCASQCESREDEGMFRAFKSYFYDYEVTIDSRIDGGASEQTSRVNVQAVATIEGLGPCEMVLKLSDISISEMREDGTMVAAATARDFSESLEAHPLRFAMESNGTITSLCPEAGEEIWALNAKRGFLSAVQTKRTRANEVQGQASVFETDVTGTCMPMYQSEDNVITKTQDYLMCKNRTNLNMFVDAVPVHLLAPTASPMKSQLECRYESDEQSLTSVTCTENHTLKPFAQSDSQPSTAVVTSITRRSITHRITSSLSNAYERQTTLLYEDPKTNERVNSRKVLNTLTEICDSLVDGVSTETPGLYDMLTSQLGNLNMDNMNTVITKMFRICPNVSPSTKKDVINMMKDALIDCDSEQCQQGFNTIVQTENSAENDIYLRKWFMKLVFHKNPTKNMISLVKRHVSGSEDMNVPAYYALSSMIYQYCRFARGDCSRDEDILAAAAIFEDNLHDACLPETEEETKQMLMSLRVIGNTGLVQSKALLNRCNRDRNPMKIRVASIEAFRRSSCDDVPTDRFMRIFDSTEEDSELRIAAFRAVIRCPSDIILAGIQQALAREPTHQVSCYVSSYLTNLRDTNNPLLRELQMKIKASPLVNTTQCNMDVRKFSRNYAFSRYDEESGNGINVDGDVIFSSKSYLPRTIRLGMDVDVFGYELDLFEVEGRMEGLQELFEAAILPDEDDRESNMLQRVNYLLKKTAYRNKREGVKTSSLNRIKSKYMQNHESSEDMEEGSVSMKILDREVFYKDQGDFQELTGKFSQENIMTIVASLMQQRSHEYTLNKKFKPSTVTIPTIAGMPLQVNIEGALTTSIKASGKFDVMRMALKPRSMSVIGSFEPSAAVEVHSSMIVDAHCARSGLTHKTNMASSLSMGGSITFEDGTFRISMDAPDRRQTIINATSSLYFLQNDEMIPVAESEDAVQTVDETFSCDQYSLRISGTRPTTPLALPESLYHNWRMQMYFDKLDDTLTTYDFEVGYTTDKEFLNGAVQKTERFHLLVGAPGSETIGTYAMNLAYHHSNMTVRVHAETPYSDTYFTGSLRNDTYHKNLQLHTVYNGQEYIVQAGLDTIPLVDQGMKYVPVFNLTIAGYESYALEGNVTLTSERKELDLSLVGGNKNKLVAFKGDLIKNDTHRLLSFSETLGPFRSSFQAGYIIGTTEDAVSITPIFNMATSLPMASSLRLEAATIVVTNNGGVIFQSLSLASSSRRLIEISNFHLQKTSPIMFSFEGMIKETIPFGINFTKRSNHVDNVLTHSADLTATTSFGTYHARVAVANNSAENLYTLEATTDINATEYFSVSAEFKDETDVQRYLDTSVMYRGGEIYRSKTGYKQKLYNSKARYTPIFILDVPSLGNLNLKLKGSCDVAEDNIVIKDLTLLSDEDIISISGEAGIDRDMRRVDWSFTLGGAYMASTVEGAASNFENTVTFNNVVTRQDGTENPDKYTIIVDMRNSTSQDEIFAWDAKVVFDASANQQLSFRFDSAYNLSPGSCQGDIIRLCYDGVDCTSTDKKITLGHEISYNLDGDAGIYSHEVDVTFTHPAQDQDFTLSFDTSYYHVAVITSQISVLDHEEVVFESSFSHTPEASSRNASTVITFEIPGGYSYESRDTYRFTNPQDQLWVSEFRSGENEMSFMYSFTQEESEAVVNNNLIMKYTDIRGSVYRLEDRYEMDPASPSNSIHRMTIKENEDTKMSLHQEHGTTFNEDMFNSRTVYVLKYLYGPGGEYSINTTTNVDMANSNNAESQVQLRFLPGQKPITLIVNFNNHTTQMKKDGDLTATLTLEQLTITVFAAGKLEMGVPSGNLSIKFLPLIGASRSFGVDLVVKNKSTEDTNNYESIIVLSAPDHKASIKHTFESRKEVVLPLTSDLTGAWNGEEISVGFSTRLLEIGATELIAHLTLPEHRYVFTNIQETMGRSRSFTITKDGETILDQGFTMEKEESSQGATYTWSGRYIMMGNAYRMDVTLANLTTSRSVNVQVDRNDFESLYADVTVTLYSGAHFDVSSELRSEYLPGYNTNVDITYEKTQGNCDITSTVQVDSTDVFYIAITNGTSSEDLNVRVTRLIVKQPTNPELRLRQVVIEDSCTMNADGRFAHNTTLLWGSLLPTQVIGLKVRGQVGAQSADASVNLLNPGRVMGFGSQYTTTFSKSGQGLNRNGVLSMTGETGNIFTIETDYKNASQEYTKDYLIKVTFTRAQKEPVMIMTTLVHNSSNTVLDADLTITYDQDSDNKLTTGVEVTRHASGHSTVLTVQHLANGIDVTIMGSYSNTSDEFVLTLENSVMIGDEMYQPEISCSLNRETKEIDFMYAGTKRYGFHGQFINRTTERGPIYEINCRNTYGERIVPYTIILDKPDRVAAFRVMYNPDNVEDFWELATGYANDTAVYARLDTMHSAQLTTNGSVVVSLTGPKVVTTHIKWEPSWPADLKAAVLNIAEKINQSAADHKMAVSEIWTTIGEKVTETKMSLIMANVDIVTSAIMLRTQVATQFALTIPMWQAQHVNIMTKWNQLNQTFQANRNHDGPSFVESQELFGEQFGDIAEYFTEGFALYSEDVQAKWEQFVAAGAALGDQYDGEAIATHMVAYNEAQSAFWESLFEQLTQDMQAMKPDQELIAEHFMVMAENMKLVGARVLRELMTRIEALQAEFEVYSVTTAQIRLDAEAFLATLEESVAGWTESAQIELEPFRQPDFSQYVAIAEEFKEFFASIKEPLRMQLLMGGGQFIAPYAALLIQPRMRRQAPDLPSAIQSPNTMDIQAIKDALSQFNSRYSMPKGSKSKPSITVDAAAAPNVEVVDTPDVQAVAVEVTDERDYTVLNIVKKILNGTLDVVTFDMDNGEILFRVVIKDFSNMTSPTMNMTQSLLDRFLPRSFNKTKVEQFIAMFESKKGLLSEYQRRFQAQFTANRTYYEEIVRDIQTHAAESIDTHIKPYIQSQVRPYLERLDEEIRTRSRPFFGSGSNNVVALPEGNSATSFFETLTSQMDIKGLERMAGRVKQAACGMYNKMTSVAAAAKMATRPSRWMPPYRANALIVGASHYMTFDQEFYDFSGKCGYVLAKDFVHENDFTAIVDYEREMEVPIRNMMFMINSTTFEIKSDGSVLVNRQARELPLQVDDTIVVRIGDSIFLKNAHGVSYVCKLQHDVCMMMISGRYFARTGGLLGNFNFEPADDFKTPDNMLQTNITSFAESWKVGKNCEQMTAEDRNRVMPSSANLVNFDPLQAENQPCASMFLDQCSSLAQCHNNVDPDAFYRMCVMDTRGLPEDERSAKMCSIAAAYRTQCWNSGNPTDMPDSCTTCENGDETYDASTPIKIENEDVLRKVDVVIVVEEKSCVESVAPRLDDLVIRLAGELKENGFNDTNFGLVGFGGANIHDAPHEHTINHQIFNNYSNEFVLGRDSLEFADERTGSNDTFAAIRLAANYPFRTGVAKHIILLSCSDCSKRDTNMKFSDLSVMLNKRNISLTMLTDFQFSLKKEMAKNKAKSKSEQIYGVDATSVFTSKMAGQDSFKGDRALRDFVNEPSNLCTLLATETGGAVFDAALLGNKGFDEVFVARVVGNSEPAACQNCRCVPDMITGTGRTVCETCVDPMNPLNQLIRGGIRDFEFTYNLPHANFNPRHVIDEEVAEEE